MWTEAARGADLIRTTVPDARAEALLYQARVNLELHDHAAAQAHEALDQLNFHNFARAFGSDHMTEGVFGADIHAAQMLTFTQRVFGFLLAAVTAGHRFTRALNGARSRDRGPDWRALRQDLRVLEATFVAPRNFLEHLDKGILASAPLSAIDCSFTPEAALTCRDARGTVRFDFSKQALIRPRDLYFRVLEMLRARPVVSL